MRRRRALTLEERRLWAGVAGTAAPLPGKSVPIMEETPALSSMAPLPKDVRSPEPAVTRRVGRPAAIDERKAGAEAPSPSPAADLRRQTRKMPAPAMPEYRPPVSAPAAAPLFHPIERPVKRKIAKGRVPIEDRIDLHDKTQVVAHYALLGFLRHAQGAGMRHVLVITGRGTSFGSRGVIRRALPHWFQTAEFRGLVAGFEPAERTHGGDGAFYVRVRRR